MPKLTVDGVGAFDVPQGKRLVLALEDEAKVDQMHACGGNARCTTCRVEFVAGEPDQMTEAEKNVLANSNHCRRERLLSTLSTWASVSTACVRRLSRRRVSTTIESDARSSVSSRSPSSLRDRTSGTMAPTV